MIATMGDFTSTATSVGKTGLAKTGVSPLSAVAISVATYQPTIGPGERVQMTDRGLAIVNASPSLKRQADSIADPDVRRGFYLAIGTLSGREFKPDAMRATLSAKNQQGFDAGMVAFKSPVAVTGSGAPTSSASESTGPSRTVIIGAVAVVALGAAAAVAYKMRKR